jgi:SAM-dependent methyltransferase
MSLREAWDRQGPTWTRWARTPGHDSFSQFHGERFFSLLPAPGRLTVDIGAGEGRVSRALRPRGYNIFEVEGSEYLARANAELTEGRVVRADAARLPLRDRVADLAIAFMSMQDVDEMPAAIAEAARILEPGGHLVMAIVHPVNSAGAFEKAAPGEPEHDRRFVIDGSYVDEFNYADDIVRDGLPMRFESAHRPIESYSRALEHAGFAIEAVREVCEPNPDDKWHRVPLFLDLRAVRLPVA